jgi:glycerol-3-phosphate dehydrogenase
LAQQNSSGNNRYRNEKHSIEPIALETEIEFVLETAQRYLVKTHTGRRAFCFAGLRPLAAPDEPGKSTKEVS